MTHTHAKPIQTETVSLAADQLTRLKELFPEVFTEGNVDWDRLRATLGHVVDESPERYTFTWAGKRDAIRLLQTPTRATLIPCRQESVNFDGTQHLFIEGDNLGVLKLLYKPYFGRVKMIYIDPPYNTGHDFIYPYNYADPLATYLQLTGQQDAEGNLLTSNPETSGRYHSAWLSMMYPRLFLACQLLREDGVIFVGIDDHEVHNLRLLMNEVFGEENFVECFIWKKSYGGGAKEKHAVTQHEYILLFARNLEAISELWLPPDPQAEKRYYRYQDERGPYRLKPLEATKSMDRRENLVFPISLPWGGEVWPKGHIVIDFFAGSCTAAQAVLELNREDDGNRRFIMVQLPEPTPEGSPARQASYETIADIGKERIRRVIAQMQREREGQLPLETREAPEDLGFKVFKLTPSNYQLWRGVGEDTPDAYAEQMALFADPLVDGWTAENVIYEVAVKEGYGLNCQITPLPLAGEGPGVRAFRVTDPDKEQFFYICLDNATGLDDLSALNLDKDDLFICRDVALDDEAAANLALQCRLKVI